MRIGIDARLWNETGVGRYIRNLVKHLQAIDLENEYVLFVRSDSLENLKSQISNLKWRVVCADVRWHSFREQWEMPRVLGKEKLDLVHFPYFNVPIFYNRPFVVTIHDLIITHFPTGRATTLPWPLYQIKRLGYKMALSHAVKNSKKIIAVSETTQKEIIDHFGVDPSKIVVTYESGELEAGNLTIKQSNNETITKTPYLLYVGNAHPHKNLERLLESFQKLKTQNSRLRQDYGGQAKFKIITASAGSRHSGTSQNLKLVLVGKDDYFYERLRKTVGEMGLENEVVFYGEAGNAELQKLYQNAVALILPSLMEGFGLPALEAMGQGCLVLASDIPSLHEVCHDAAIYFNPQDTDEIAEKINLAMGENEEKEKLTKMGLELAKKFSWEKMTKKTLEVYNALVS